MEFEEVEFEAMEFEFRRGGGDGDITGSTRRNGVNEDARRLKVRALDFADVAGFCDRWCVACQMASDHCGSLVATVRTIGLLACRPEAPLVYRHVTLDACYFLDMMVDDRVIVELKSVDVLAPMHGVQMLTYLRLTQCPVGLLINFNVQLLKDGIQRIVNTMP